MANTFKVGDCIRSRTRPNSVFMITWVSVAGTYYHMKDVNALSHAWFHALSDTDVHLNYELHPDWARARDFSRDLEALINE